MAGGGREAATGVLDRIVTVGLRSITWPVTGLITDRLVVSLIGAADRDGAGRHRGAWGVGGGDRPGGAGGCGAAAARLRSTSRPFAGSPPRLGYSVVALAVFAPSLAVIVPELPNDHYHAFLDPIVLTLVGVGLARLAGGCGAGGRSSGSGCGSRARSPDPCARSPGASPPGC